MERLVVWGGFVAVMTAACFWRPRPMRAVVGVFFALMGLGVHGSFVMTNPQGYVDFAHGALLPGYRELAVAIVEVWPRGFGAFMLVFEVVLAGLILSRGKAVKVGLLAGMAFLVGISPLGLEVLPNAVLAIGLGRLLREEYPSAVPAELGAWLVRRREAARRQLGH